MEKQIAKELLSINAVFLRPEQPFTWASGIKSPIYCDNRLIQFLPRLLSSVPYWRERPHNGQILMYSLPYPEL